MQHPASRRTTLTLPTRCLDLAEQIARERHVNLSSVIGEALSRGLLEEEHLQRSETILQSYKKAFAGFSAEELLLLDGVVTEEIRSRKSRAGKLPVGRIRRRVRK